MSAEDASTMSKSARKRANQKAREAEAAAAEAPPAPAPKAAATKAAPKAKAAAAAPAAPAEPKAKAKGKAKAEPKAPEPAPKAEAKAKAKGKAEPKPAAAPKEVAAEPKAVAKGAAKSKAKAKKAEAVPAPAPVPVPAEFQNFEMDDGSGGGWDVASGVDKKQQRRLEKAAAKKAEDEANAKAGVLTAKAGQHVPGLAPAAVQVAQASKNAKGKSVNPGGVAGLLQEAKEAAALLNPKPAFAPAAPVAAKEAEPVAPVSATQTSVQIKMPEAKIGRVVGPKGANINMIKEKTGVKTIDLAGDLCTIIGEPDEVVLAEAAVRQLIEKGYMHCAFDDFEEEGVPVHPSVFPDIIGSRGAIIQLIKKEAKVEVDIPQTPKDATSKKQKYKVGLAGSKPAVALGKEIIESIEMYGHHEVTHPGMSHEEMEIEDWQYRFLIGSKGSEMRHIQNNFKVRVNIPREFSACRNVVIIGEPADVDRAVKYITKTIEEASQPKGREAPEKAQDTWGEEGAVEDWMKPYMYNRR